MRHDDPYLHDDAAARADELAVKALFDATAPAADPMQVERLAARAVDAAVRPSAARWPWLGGLLAIGVAGLAFFMLSPPPMEGQVGPGDPIAVLSPDAGAEPLITPGSATSGQTDDRPDGPPDPFDWDDQPLLLDEGDDITAGLDLLAGPTSVEETEGDWQEVLHAAPPRAHQPI